ncbi:hypothetical protein E2C01_070970 [Portunus trituberculatus]|uniref:Uncharacterized protein n=1 Tax=Portunus trituberculatus TaxID=210409 RepID=A0A5B7I6W0_PORTR|nr:hypothetical protein [Portunus trituberculatus]
MEKSDSAPNGGGDTFLPHHKPVEETRMQVVSTIIHYRREQQFTHSSALLDPTSLATSVSLNPPSLFNSSKSQH